MFEIGVETFFWVELGAIAREVEQFDLICPLGDPCFHELAVMHPQVVQNQEHFSTGVLDQGGQEFDQLAGGQGAHGALAGEGIELGGQDAVGLGVLGFLYLARRYGKDGLARLGLPDGLAVLEEEIFGPILPLLVYDKLADALAWIQARPRPLALYLFDHDRARIRQVLKQTHAGGVVINDTLLHVVRDSLPFGGVGASGMGQYHGHHGFLTFSKLKPVLYQARLNAMPLLRPPYGRLLRWLQTWMIR